MSTVNSLEEEVLNLEIRDIDTGKWIDNFQAHGRFDDKYVYVDKATLSRKGFYFPKNSKLVVSSINAQSHLRIEVKLDRISRYYIIFEITGGKETLHHDHVQVKPFMYPAMYKGWTYLNTAGVESVLTDKQFKNIIDLHEDDGYNSTVNMLNDSITTSKLHDGVITVTNLTKGRVDTYRLTKTQEAQLNSPINIKAINIDPEVIKEGLITANKIREGRLQVNNIKNGNLNPGNIVNQGNGGTPLTPKDIDDMTP